MNERDKALRKSRRSKSKEHWEIYKTLRNRCNNMLKYSKRQYHHNLLEDSAENPKEFWKCIKNIFPTKIKRRVSENVYDPSKPSNQQSSAQSFSDYFSNIIATSKKQSFPLVNFAWRLPTKIKTKTFETFTFKYVSAGFVENQLKKMKRGKSAGVDELPPGLIKDCAKTLTKPVKYIINLSLKTATVPTNWKKAKIVPVFKKGISSSVEN